MGLRIRGKKFMTLMWQISSDLNGTMRKQNHGKGNLESRSSNHRHYISERLTRRRSYGFDIKTECTISAQTQI